MPIPGIHTMPAGLGCRGRCAAPCGNGLSAPNTADPPIAAAVAAIMLLTNFRRLLASMASLLVDRGAPHDVDREILLRFGATAHGDASAEARACACY
jgi:hypothetical protein